MSDGNAFVFDNEADVVGSDDLVIRIPAAVSDFNELFSAYYEQLELPGYVGKNWNALSDSLRDLSWVQHRRVVIVHQDVPQLSATDIAEYCDVLQECVNDWKLDKEHELLVLFPAGSRDSVIACMKNCS